VAVDPSSPLLHPLLPQPKMGREGGGCCEGGVVGSCWAPSYSLHPLLPQPKMAREGGGCCEGGAVGSCWAPSYSLHPLLPQPKMAREGGGCCEGGVGCWAPLTDLTPPLGRGGEGWRWGGGGRALSVDVAGRRVQRRLRSRFETAKFIKKCKFLDEKTFFLAKSFII